MAAIYTYYSHAFDPKEQERLIQLWSENWKAHGWDPQVLGEDTAKQHPLFGDFIAKIRTLPSVNIPEYEHACWLRWLALDVVEGNWASDYDVFLRNGGFSDKPWPKTTLFQCETQPGQPYMGGGAATATPSLVYTPDAREIVDLILDYQPDENDFNSQEAGGRPHISDMTLFRRTGAFDVFPLVAAYTGPGWEKAKVVHFAHGCFHTHEARLHRSETIQRLVALPAAGAE